MIPGDAATLRQILLGWVSPRVADQLMLDISDWLGDRAEHERLTTAYVTDRSLVRYHAAVSLACGVLAKELDDCHEDDE